MPPGGNTPQRFEFVGTTPHRHEREGLEWLTAALPTYGSFGGFALFSFQTDDGRRYEVDAIAMTAHCLYVIELKAWRGRLIDGDVRHLVTRSPERGREVVDHPLPLLETKTKALMDRVRRVARSMRQDLADTLRTLWAEPLVWLTHAEGTELDEHDAALSHVVVGRHKIGDALRQASFPGARDDLKAKSTNVHTLRALQTVLRDSRFGFGRIDKPLTVLDGRLDLTKLVEEGDDYQDHWATPHGVGPPCRVRSYLAPNSDRAFVQKLDRRVEREAKVLLRLGDHPNILALEQFDPKAPLGPALVFRGFAGKTLDAFLKEERDPSGRSTVTLDDKLTILRRVADALAFCHRNDVVHGAFSPEAVLVHRGAGAAPAPGVGETARPSGPLEVRLTRFALAATGEASSQGTRLFTRLAGASATLYEAPEVALGAAPTEASDLFSLGALAYYLLAEQPPAANAAELAQRLARDHALVISAVRDDLFPAGVGRSIDDVLLSATFVDPTERLRDLPTMLDFVDRLEEALTAPEPMAVSPTPDPPARDLDPLQATKGSLLGDLKVLGELGSGATARVLKVQHGDDEVALKVPLSDAHDERIAREGEVLARLRRVAGVDRIAHLIETRTIAGRTCLLVQLAGDRTLADEIRAEGALSLDYARRWGDDLLTALRSLEEAGVQHRDIKPANIGLTGGTEKGKKRLLLFDFSLSERPAEDIAIGTPAYKDPELPARGRWDDAADRWAAAITLHEMFTGVRPAPIPGAAPGAVAVRLEPDRLDADVRDGLVRFFERALSMSARERFATADDMRDAFIRALHKVPEHAGAITEEPAITAADLQGLGPEARVGDLALSTRQKNALDRMGIYTLHELAQLSKNRIGGVRGVGAKTARSLVDLAGVVRAHLEVSASEPVVPFFRGFGGARRPVGAECEAGRLSPSLARRFAEAGLADSLAVASAPEAQVKNLIARARKEGAAEGAKDVTQWLEALVDEERPPTTLGAAALLIAPSAGPKGGASRLRVRQYLGLEPLEGFPRHGMMFDLARAAGVTRALVSIDLAKARERWLGGATTPGLPLEADAPPAKSRALAVLERVDSAVRGVLATSAGVAPIARAAAAVIEAFPPEPDLTPDAVQRSAEALVRAVTELDTDVFGGRGAEDARLRLRRIRDREVLVAHDRASFELAANLGKEADALVDRDGVVAEATAATNLRAVTEDARARALGDRALVMLAAATAERARISARGELYAAGLDAERAILLSAAAIAGRLEIDELHRRVRARYPESAPFPDDPAVLARIAEKLALRFEERERAFFPRERTLGLGPTEFGSSRTTSPKTVPAVARSERAAGDVVGATAIRVFDEELERAKRDGAFRVLLWRGQVGHKGAAGERGAPDAEYVARAIAQRTSGEHSRFDALLVDAAEAVAREKNLPNGLKPAIAADVLGPDGARWSKLVDLMRPAAARSVEEVLASTRVRVLTRLGLLARYDLLSAIAEVAIAHRGASEGRDGGEGSGSAKLSGRSATFVVLPVHMGEGAVIEVRGDVASRVGAVAGTFLVPVPGLLPHEILEVPDAWVKRYAAPRRTSAPNLVAQRL